MELSLIKIAVADHIAVVTMDHPPVNAQNAQFNIEMAYAFDMVSDRKDVRVVVLTGAGKTFSAGADLKGRPDRSKLGERWQHNRRARESYHAIRECTKPVIAAINGAGARRRPRARRLVRHPGRGGGGGARPAGDRRRPARRRQAHAAPVRRIRRCGA